MAKKALLMILDGWGIGKHGKGDVINNTPDHLDRYEFKMQNYTDAKMRITQNQTEEDSFP